MPLIHVLGVAPGPSHHQLQSYLAPLAADELAYILEHGIQDVDSFKDPTHPSIKFDCKVMLVLLTADLRAIVKLEPNSSAPCGEGGCMRCGASAFRTGGTLIYAGL